MGHVASQKVRSKSGDPSFRLYGLWVKNRDRFRNVVSGVSCSVCNSRVLLLSSRKTIASTSSRIERCCSKLRLKSKLPVICSAAVGEGAALIEGLDTSEVVDGCCERAAGVLHGSKPMESPVATAK